MTDLQAGREMDVLMAERVMGWTKGAFDGIYYWRDAETDTAPLAICLAALKAVGE